MAAARAQRPAERRAAGRPEAGGTVQRAGGGRGPGGPQSAQQRAALHDGASEARGAAPQRGGEARVLHTAPGHLGTATARATPRRDPGLPRGIPGDEVSPKQTFKNFEFFYDTKLG